MDEFCDTLYGGGYAPDDVVVPMDQDSIDGTIISRLRSLGFKDGEIEESGVIERDLIEIAEAYGISGNEALEFW